MADRFPSLDDFEGGKTAVNEAPDGGSFLDRERALLGEDAAQFASVEDTKLATVEDAEDDLLGGAGGDMPEFHGDSQFESAFPEIGDQNENIGPGGAVTGNATSYPPPSYSEPEPEPAVITEWREKRDAQVSQLDSVQAQMREDAVKAARQNIDDFYENYNDKKDKSIAKTRKEAEEFLASRDDTTAGGTSWERIAKLVDLHKGGVAKGVGGSAGKERFREMLLSLRKDEKAPGASGI